MSSFDLETGEPFPGTTGSPYLKINDNYILNVWESKFCKSGNPRYSIDTCDDPGTDEVEWDDPDTDGERVRRLLHRQRRPGHRGLRARLPRRRRLLRHRHLGRPRPAAVGGLRRGRRRGRARYRRDPLQLPVGGAGRDRHPEGARRRHLRLARTICLDDPGMTPDIDETEVTSSSATSSGSNPSGSPPAAATSTSRWSAPPAAPASPSPGRRTPTAAARQGQGPRRRLVGRDLQPQDRHLVHLHQLRRLRHRRRELRPRRPAGGTDAEPTATRVTRQAGSRTAQGPVPFSCRCGSPTTTWSTPTPSRSSRVDCVTPDCAREHRRRGVLPRSGRRHLRAASIRRDIAKEFCDHPNGRSGNLLRSRQPRGRPQLRGPQGSLRQPLGDQALRLSGQEHRETITRPGLWVAGGDGMPDYQYYVDRGGTLDLCELSERESPHYMEALPGTTAHERWYGFVNSAGSLEAGLRQLRMAACSTAMSSRRGRCSSSSPTPNPTAARAPGRSSPMRSPRVWATRSRRPSTRMVTRSSAASCRMIRVRTSRSNRTSART